MLTCHITNITYHAVQSGVTYTRWGKTSCPSSTGAQLVYSGRAGGSNHRAQGGAAEIICLPDDPDYSNTTLGVSVIESSRVQGVEYELCFGPVANVCEHNAPCAVCYVPTRETVIMVPAKTVCPSSWTREYSGYLTTMLDTHYRSSYNCLDMTPEAVAESSANANPALFYYTTTDCNGLACPPYENNRILSCAVCTK